MVCLKVGGNLPQAKNGCTNVPRDRLYKLYTPDKVYTMPTHWPSIIRLI